MREYLPPEQFEHGRLFGVLADTLADTVDTVMNRQHEPTKVLDIVDNVPLSVTERERSDHLTHSSALRHINDIVGLGAKHSLDQPTKVAQARHAVLVLQDAVTGEQLLLTTTRGTVTDGRHVSSTDVYVNDDAIITQYSMCKLGDNVYQTRKSLNVIDGRIVNEAFALVEAKSPGLSLGLLSGTENPLNVAQRVKQIRPLVLEQYSQAETDRFINDLVKRFNDKCAAYALEQKLGGSALSVDDLNEAIDLFQDPDRWT